MDLYKYEHGKVCPFPWEGSHPDDEKYAVIIRAYENEELLKKFGAFTDTEIRFPIAYRKREVIRNEILKRMEDD